MGKDNKDCEVGVESTEATEEREAHTPDQDGNGLNPVAVKEEHVGSEDVPITGFKPNDRSDEKHSETNILNGLEQTNASKHLPITSVKSQPREVNIKRSTGTNGRTSVVRGSKLKEDKTNKIPPSRRTDKRAPKKASRSVKDLEIDKYLQQFSPSQQDCVIVHSRYNMPKSELNKANGHRSKKRKHSNNNTRGNKSENGSETDLTHSFHDTIGSSLQNESSHSSTDDSLNGTNHSDLDTSRKHNHDFKILQDSVHGTIKLDPLLVAIIDTPQFQRLRDIKQLGGGYWVFPGACHNRFEHSIGTSYLCGLMLTTLKDLHETENDNLIPEITNKEILCVKVAGLCHDLGHGPFSHVFDGKYIKRFHPEAAWTHEQASCDLFDHMVDTNHGLKSLMEENGIGVKERELIKSMIKGKDPQKDNISEKWMFDEIELEKWYLYEIVSNKRSGIDCDKFDYFARDTHNLGMKHSFDFMRFFQNIRIIAVDRQLQICVRDKEMFNIYELFHVRWSLHYQVYQHKSTKVIEEMLCEALSKVDSKFGLSSSIYDMERYTYLTDSIIYEVLRLKDEDDGVIAAKEILGRIQRRQLYHLCGQINPDSTMRKSEEISLSQPVTAQCDVIKEEIIEQFENLLDPVDVFVDIVTINHGMKDQNPVEKVLFFSKDGVPKFLRRDHLSDTLPSSFQEKYIRVYSTSDDKIGVVKHAFRSWCKKKGYLIPDSLTGKKSGYFSDVSKSGIEISKLAQRRLHNVQNHQEVRRKLSLLNDNEGE